METTEVGIVVDVTCFHHDDWDNVFRVDDGTGLPLWEVSYWCWNPFRDVDIQRPAGSWSVEPA